MSNDDSIKLQSNYNIKKIVEEEVIEALQKEEYTLNTVNSNGENLLHISAANGCLNIIKEILRNQDFYHVIDRKNKFGWTPLMLAIRNRHSETVKFLLEKHANVNESTYLGMSIFGLAAAINTDMFEIVYEACPSALFNSVNDDITPLSIAAMKNDKNLFFQLLELGFEVSKSNECTQLMMKQSTIPDIAKLAEKHLDIEDYWNDTSDNIPLESDSNENIDLHSLNLISESKEKHVMQMVHDTKNKCDNENENNNNMLSLNFPTKPVFVFHSSELKSEKCNNDVTMNSEKCPQSYKLNLMIKHLDPTQHSLISPTLTCALNEMLPVSPNIYFTQNNYDDKSNVNENDKMKKEQSIQDRNEISTQHSKTADCLTKLSSQRLQSIRPSDLNIQSDQEDPNATLVCIPEYSPVRSPHVPPHINDENVFGENTPTPPRYKTPPRGMVLNSEEVKMFVLLKRYGLSQHVRIFLEQEIDIDLFTTLTDKDLIEIGIKDESDRKAILNVIMDYKYSMI